MKLAYYWATHPRSNLQQIMTETNIGGEHTVVDFYNFYRDLCQEWAFRHQAEGQLGGLGSVVEIDESI